MIGSNMNPLAIFSFRLEVHFNLIVSCMAYKLFGEKNLCFSFLNRFDADQPAQLQRIARDLLDNRNLKKKFNTIRVVNNKDVDQTAAEEIRCVFDDI